MDGDAVGFLALLLSEPELPIAPTRCSLNLAERAGQHCRETLDVRLATLHTNLYLDKGITGLMGVYNCIASEIRDLSQKLKMKSTETQFPRVSYQ